MPISDKEWDSGESFTPLARAVRTWLCQKSPNAYSLKELNVKSIEIGRTFKTKYGRPIKQKMMEEALGELIERTDVSKVVSMEIKDKNGLTTYYRCEN